MRHMAELKLDSLVPSSHRGLRQVTAFNLFGSFVTGCYAARGVCVSRLLTSFVEAPDSFTCGCRRRTCET